MMNRLRRFVAFWYDFIVGDDWHVALAVLVALAVTYVVHRAGAPAWWILPAAVLIVLPVTVWRAARARK
jgi:hypothetical protein